MNKIFTLTPDQIQSWFIDDPSSFFCICATKEVNPENPDDVTRCDSGNFGPYGAVNADDERHDTVFGSGIIKSIEQLETYHIVIKNPENGYLIMLKLKEAGDSRKSDLESEDYLLNQEDPPCCAKTFQESLKLMSEWADMTEPVWNNQDKISKICKGILDSLEIPENIMAEIRSMPDMQIYKFLKGNKNARLSNDEAPEMSQNFWDWLFSICDTV